MPEWPNFLPMTCSMQIFFGEVIKIVNQCWHDNNTLNPIWHREGGFTPYQLYPSKTFLIGLASWALSYAHNVYFTLSGQIWINFLQRVMWHKLFVEESIIFWVLVTHTKNHLFAFCWNIATYLTLIISC